MDERDRERRYESSSGGKGVLTGKGMVEDNVDEMTTAGPSQLSEIVWRTLSHLALPALDAIAFGTEMPILHVHSGTPPPVNKCVRLRPVPCLASRFPAALALPIILPAPRLLALRMPIHGITLQASDTP